MSAAADQREWAVGVQALNDEAAGVVALQAIELTDVPHLLVDALTGDPTAHRVLGMVQDTLTRIASAPRRAPMLCASCPRPLRKGAFTIVTVTPNADSPRRGMGLAVCSRCATGHEAAKAKAGEALRRLWPDLRAISIHPAVGQA